MSCSLKKIGVVGAGQMGLGIAQVCAAQGFQTILQDISASQLEKAKNQIAQSLEKLASKGKISGEAKEKALQNLTTTTELQNLKEADFVIEAATEKADLKSGIFKTLDGLCGPETILASNTSSIPIHDLAAATRRPDKVIGMHFMNPVPLMQCVEVIRADATSDKTHQVTLHFAEHLGKTPVTVKDAPGFVINRILMPMIQEAVSTLEEGLATKEDIDLAMKIGCNFPMGPLTLADFIGLDTCLFILETMGRKPSGLLQRMVANGKLGRKSGEGFYRYGL